MERTHWKKLTNPNYLGAYELLDSGDDLILTIDHVKEEKVIGTDGKKDDCVVAHFRENVKPMILNATNLKMIQKLYKTPFIEEWQGKKIQVGVEKVKAFGEIVDALRVRKFIPQTAETEKFLCECCGDEIQPMKNKTAEALAKYTKTKYGAALCAKCATKAAQNENKGVNEDENG